MRIADQLKLNSKLVNTQKAKATLKKTLAEKRKKEKALQDQIAKKKAEKLRQEIELKNTQILKRYFDRFLNAAWQGNRYIEALQSDQETCHLLKKYGLELLSTEEFVDSLNKNLNKINRQIDLINSSLSNSGIFEENFIPRCLPKDLRNKKFDFLKNISLLEKRTTVKQNEILNRIQTLKIEKLNQERSVIRKQSKYQQLEMQLNSLAKEYSFIADRFEEMYLDSLNKARLETLYLMPELRDLTYYERLGSRKFQFLNAVKTFNALGIDIPEPPMLGIHSLSTSELLSEISELLSEDHIDLIEIDAIGRYIAFFKVLCGGPIKKSISEIVKEPFSIDINSFEKSMVKISNSIENESRKLKSILKLQFKKKILKINEEINFLKMEINGADYSVPYCSSGFTSELVFDLNNLTHPTTKDITPFDSFAKEIKWILSPKGRLNLRKFFKKLEQTSLKGLHTCSLPYEQKNNKIIFKKDGTMLFEFSTSLESLIKMLKVNGLSHFIMKTKNNHTLKIKWA